MPSPITVFVATVSGFCLFAAVYFLAVYFMMGRKYLDRLCFGMMALLGAGFAFSMLFQLKAPDVETYRRSLLWYLGIFIPNFLIFLHFTANYTGHRSKWFLRLMAAVTVLLTLVHVLRPFGLVTDGLREFGTTALPWGEPVTRGRSIPSIWVAPFYVYLFVGLVYALRAGWSHGQRHRWRRGKGFVLSVCVSFLAGANNLLVDLGRLQGPYISEAAVLAFIMFMTLALAGEWRDQDRFYRQIFDLLNDGLFVFDLDSGQVVQANDTAARLFRAPREDLVGKGLARFREPLGQATPQRLTDAIRRCQTEGPQSFEAEADRFDHTSFWADVSLRAVTLMGRARGIAVVRDITERQKMERERQRLENNLHEAQRLESLGMMAGGVAHDFNNILMAIQGNVELLELRPEPGPDLRESVSNVRSAVRSAAELCRQLLAYAGKGRLSPELIDFGQLVREVGRMVEAGVTKKAHFTYDIGEGLPSVHGDATQIRQVVLNILTNAAEALGEEGGQVSVTLDTETLQNPAGDELRGGPYLRLQVTDTGCGMSAETQARIFDPFFTTKLTGRGLGLAAVRGILRAHQGAIQVTSELGRGTTMTVLLPAAAGKPDAIAKREMPRKFKGRILLVDDEDAVRRVTRQLLVLLGLDVVDVANASQALQAFREDPSAWTGVMLDFRMPDMDGLEAYRRLHEMRPELPGILATGYGLADKRQSFAQHPRLLVIQKPYSNNDLIKALSDLRWPTA